MMTKSSYRDYFKSIMRYVKLTKIAEDNGIAKSTVSMFLKDSHFDYQMSLEKLELLKKIVDETILDLVH